MADALSARGTVLKMGDGGGPETFTPVAKIISISGPGIGLDTEDSTDHESPQGWEEAIATIKRSGEISMDLHFLPGSATHGAAAGLIKKLNDRTKTNFQLVFPDAGVTTWTFAAFVTGFEAAAPHDGKLTASCKLKITGVPTLV